MLASSVSLSPPHRNQMKLQHYSSTVEYYFQISDKVLALLAIPVSTLCTMFSGPCEIHNSLSDMNYVIGPPEKRYNFCS